MEADLRLRVLKRAADIVGGPDKLRNRLSVEQHALDLWLSGRATPPERVLAAAMDLVLRDDMARAGIAPKTKILVAVGKGAVERLTRALAGHDLRFAMRLADAIDLLEREEFGMVIIGVYFDESRMFELLHHVRINRKDPAVPVVCILDAAASFSSVVVEGLDHAAKSLMANAFLDLRKMPDDEKGNARLRRVIEHLILIDGDMHQGLEENA